MEELVERYRLAITLILAVVLIGGVAAFLARRPDARPIEIVTPTRVPKSTPQALKVYVTGEVATPGVYTLQENDRVEDAVRAAGGPAPEADLIKVNLAVRLRDQMQIHVPKKSTAGSGPTDPPSPNTPSKVNINTASAQDLDALPGIGPTISQRIVSYRQQNGPFKRLEDLKEAKLINNSTFEKIKDLVVAY